MNTKKFALIVLTLAVAASLIGVASASTLATGVGNCWVGVNPSDHSGQANLGSTVYVYFSGVTPTGAAVDVTVYDPSGALVSTTNGVTTSGAVSFTASMPGTYYVRLDGYPSYHAVTTFVAGASLIVLPEGVLGTLLGVVSAVGAVAVIGVVKKRKAD
jgi:hypothetical protein